MSYDLAIPSWVYIQMKTIIQKDSLPPMFITALFTVAKRWKQPNVHWQMDKEDVYIYIYTHTQWNTNQP